MNEAIARQLVAEYQAYGQILNRLTEISYQIDDPLARSAVRKAAFDATCSIYEGIRDALGEEFKVMMPKDITSS